MNERIQELYMQAIQYADSVVPADGRYNDIYYAIVSGKHAELIVRECADIANRQFSAATGLDDRDCLTARQMKQHFGVEL